ncbi:hypothetical protein, partial [Klebsiella pneumoniae]|uniref:hypothetical protein n=1 Tax=Klebsiella pneumoniae TaxID=573 RepID=UPI0027301E6C
PTGKKGHARDNAIRTNNNFKTRSLKTIIKKKQQLKQCSKKPTNKQIHTKHKFTETNLQPTTSFY